MAFRVKDLMISVLPRDGEGRDPLCGLTCDPQTIACKDTTVCMGVSICPDVTYACVRQTRDWNVGGKGCGKGVSPTEHLRFYAARCEGKTQFDFTDDDELALVHNQLQQALAALDDPNGLRAEVHLTSVKEIEELQGKLHEAIRELEERKQTLR